MKNKIAIIALAGMAALSAQETTRKASEGVYTKDQSDAGRSAYGAKCASCHGDSLGGGDVPPALVGGSFMSAWGGQSIFGLFDRIRTGMPPDKAGSLSRVETAQITAFILSSNGYAEGKTALPGQDELLKTILLDPKY
jgi:mono/diheme cytochrome c family protein